MSKKLRKVGFYKVTVKEHGPPFETIGLWQDYGSSQAWLFAEGDGSEMGASFTVIEVNEEMIMLDRVYEKEKNHDTTKS